MRILFLALLLFIGFLNKTQAQCPSGSFTMPDSSCSGVSISIVNTPVPGNTYDWDFCTGEMASTPTATNSGADPALNFPQQTKLIKENGNYYLFVVNFFANNMVRYDYGNSLDNTPVVFAYSFGTLTNPIGLDIINENGTWYALIANYSGTLSRVDLGTDISANTASAVNVPGPFGFSGTRSVKIVFDGTNYFAFVTNDGSADVVKIEFGNSITNNPVQISPINNSLFNFTWGIDILYDCILNKWIGFVASYNLSQVHILDFGNSPGNNPSIATSFSCAANPSGLEIVRDGQHWYMAVVGQGSMQVLRFNSNLLDTPVETFQGAIGALNNPRSFSVMADSARHFGFITNAGSNSITKVAWDSTCTSSPVISDDSAGPQVVLNGIGYVPVSLKVTDSSGFSSYFTDSIYLNAAPIVDFTFSPGCEGIAVDFTDNSYIPDSSINFYEWDFGDSSPFDNTQNPSHLYAGTGAFLVTLTAASSSGCSSFDTATVTINPIPQAAMTFTNDQCTGIPVSFTDASQAFGGNTIVTWQWGFDDGSPGSPDQNPTHVFDSSGTYNISLLVTTDAGCVDSTTSGLNVNPTPEPGFEISSTCVGETVLFDNTSTVQGGGIITYNWDFGDTGVSVLEDPSHSYATAPGNYDVQLIASSNGCADTIIQNIRIGEQPVPLFTWTPNIVCQGNAVSFISQSTGTGSDTISLYIWDFGDGSPLSNDENPFHAYPDTGFYDVTLTVVSPTYCDSSVTQQIYVIPGPTATFTASSSCFNQVTSFFPQSTTPPGTTIDSIVWDFGDSTFFNGFTSPTHLYSAPGTYQVTMTLYNNLLCTAQFIDSITVHAIPQASFVYTVPCSDSPIEFDGTTTTVDNDFITSYLWNFGGLGSATDSIAEFIFSDSGSYNVTLIVTSSHGCSDTVITPVQIIHSPDFNFTYTEPCDGTPVQFNYISNINPSPPATPFWQFGDGNSSSIFDPSHLFPDAGAYDVILTIDNAISGCSASLTQTVNIKPNPVTGFAALSSCEETPVQFNDTTSISTGSVTSWNWDFGAAGTSNIQHPVVTFQSPGTLPVTLTTTSDLGCSNTYAGSILINAKPEAIFTPDPLFGSPPLTVNMNNVTTGAVSYLWDFGDNTSGTGINPAHIYADTGNYMITLIATSNDGCTDTASFNLAVLVPFMDIAVQKIYATIIGDQFRLSADISNQGNLTVNTFTIRGTIENGSIINEYYNDTLVPGQTINYQFASSYQVETGFIPGYYCVEALNPNDAIDARPENNGKCAVVDNDFEIFTAYPNPFNNHLSLNFNLPFEDVYSVEVFDKTGRIVYREENIKGAKGFNTVNIITAAFSKGMYAVSIRYRDDIKVARTLKID